MGFVIPRYAGCVLAPAIVCLIAAQQQEWSVSRTRSLVWQGEPFVPVGVRIDGNPSEISKASAAGVKDVIVELPVDGTGWKQAIEELDKSGMTYIIAIGSVPQSAETVVVEPESYRLVNIPGGKIDRKVALPGATKAHYVLATQSSGQVVLERTSPVINGELRVQFESPIASEHVLVAYPVMKGSGQPDYWQSFDNYRDRLLKTIKDNPVGAGYRGLLNPFGKMQPVTDPNPSCVPLSEEFRLEFETYLKQKYSSVSALMSAWKCGVVDFQSMKDAAKCVPLYTDSRGVQQIWNPDLDQTYRGERTGNLWGDIRTVMAASANRRFQRLADSVRQLTGKPVMQDWMGWSGATEQDTTGVEAIGFTGTVRSYTDSVESASKPLSSAVRRAAATVSLATGITLAPSADQVSPTAYIRATYGMGVRGWYFVCEDAAAMQAVAAAAQEFRNSRSIADAQSDYIYYPESARDPAVPSRLPSGYWWLPSSGAGDRVDFGEGIEGYQYRDRGRNTVVFWSVDQPRRVKFRMADPNGAKFRSLDGIPLDIKIKKADLEMTVPMGLVLLEEASELPVPLDSFTVTSGMVAAMLDRFGSRIDVEGVEFNNLRQYRDGFDRAPGASFLALRDQWRKLLIRAAPYAWIEGETPAMTTFGSIDLVPGASNGKAISLSARIPQEEGNTSRYKVRVGAIGVLDVWVAGSIPESVRPLVQIECAGQSLSLEPFPVSTYGANLAWYRAGKLTLQGPDAEMVLRLPPLVPAATKIDVIMVSPGNFTPRGPKPPSAWLVNALAEGRPPAGTD